MDLYNEYQRLYDNYKKHFIKKPYWEFADIHAGEPGVLICNGPSLAQVPDKFFDKYRSMGANSIYTRDILVDYYVIEGAGHLGDFKERLARVPYIIKVGEAGGASFINRRFVHFFEFLPNVYSVDYLSQNCSAFRCFQFDPLREYGTGFCITYAMFQFMHYMGFDPVLIVGMDHRFVEGKWHYYDDKEAPEFHSMPIDEYERFRKNVDPYFEEVAKVYKNTGRMLLNLTEESLAYQFERDKLENWL